MSLGNTLGSDASIYEECIQGGYVLLGYGGGVDFKDCTQRSEVQRRFFDNGVKLEGPNDYSLTSVSAFVTRMKPGDLVVVSDGNFKFRAIGEITGDYSFKPHQEYEDGYSQMRPVKWLRQYSPSLPYSELLNNKFSQMTLYELRSPTLNREKLQSLLAASAGQNVHASSGFQPGQVFGSDYLVVQASAELLEVRKPNGKTLGLAMNLLTGLAEGVRSGSITLQDIREKQVFSKLPDSTLDPFLVNGYSNILAPLVEHLLPGISAEVEPAGQDLRVLIIDEINRGNVSRIFGELITLIEPSKRAGADEALSVVLPYSKESFSVPDNLYLIGTMNTADRSLAGLDLALRRRFTFREMPPRPDVLKELAVEGVDLKMMLEKINQRIEVLLDRDHCLGHAYFLSLRGNRTLEQLATIFRSQIIPLLQEYFFEDWERIGWVLNDQVALDNGCEPFIRRPRSEISLTSLFGSKVADKLNDQRWELNDAAFSSLASYRNILG
jgi:5-methylcytosine-specific restriction protein B